LKKGGGEKGKEAVVAGFIRHFASVEGGKGKRNLRKEKKGREAIRLPKGGEEGRHAPSSCCHQQEKRGGGRELSDKKRE